MPTPLPPPCPEIEPAGFPAPLRGLAAKVRDGVRLDEADALLALTTTSVLPLGRLADAVRKKLHGNAAFYNVNRHINPTNVCVYTYNCKFCSFAALRDEPHAWQMSLEEVYENAAEAGGNDVTEFHIVGGLHPDLDLAWYEQMLRGLKERFPDAHLKALTAIEIGWFAKREKLAIRTVLERLVAAGLGSLPGGGAEIFHPEVREVICDGKLDADEWIEVHRIAHKMGIKSNCTMLYGHVERPEHKVDHLLRLRDLQDETGGFTAFACWNLQPEGVPEQAQYPQKTTPAVYLRVNSIARIFLDNFANLQTSYVTQGMKLAQVSLRAGCNDFGGTMLEENVVSAAGCFHLASIETIERTIEGAGFLPRRRNTWYRFVDERALPEGCPRGPQDRDGGATHRAGTAAGR